MTYPQVGVMPPTAPPPIGPPSAPLSVVSPPEPRIVVRQTRSWIVAAAVGALVGALVATGIGAAVVSGRDNVGNSATSGRTPSIAGRSLDIGALLVKVRPSVVSIKIDTAGDEKAAGSGIVIDDKGTVLTNAHVINGATSISVAFADGSVEPASLVGSFPDRDVALVKTKQQKKTTPAELGSSDALKVGEDVVAIGNALNLGDQPSVTKGIVSATERAITAEGENLDHLIQTDAAINPGNSGGPLVNSEGQVVGVNTAIIQDSQSVGFAMSIDSIKQLIIDIEDGKGAITAETPVLGIVSTNVSAQPADVITQFKIDIERGAFISTVQSGSGADEAGLKAGDVITSIDGQPIDDNADVGAIIRKLKIGDKIDISFERMGNKTSTTATLKRRGS